MKASTFYDWIGRQSVPDVSCLNRLWSEPLLSILRRFIVIKASQLLFTRPEHYSRTASVLFGSNCSASSCIVYSQFVILSRATDVQLRLSVHIDQLTVRALWRRFNRTGWWRCKTRLWSDADHTEHHGLPKLASLAGSYQTAQGKIIQWSAVNTDVCTTCGILCSAKMLHSAGDMMLPKAVGTRPSQRRRQRMCNIVAITPSYWSIARCPFETRNAKWTFETRNANWAIRQDTAVKTSKTQGCTKYRTQCYRHWPHRWGSKFHTWSWTEGMLPVMSGWMKIKSKWSHGSLSHRSDPVWPRRRSSGR